MIAPYQGPYPCPTCGQGEPKLLDEMQRFGQEFDDVMSGVLDVVAEQATKEDRQDAEISRLKAELSDTKGELDESHGRTRKMSGTLFAAAEEKRRLEAELAAKDTLIRNISEALSPKVMSRKINKALEVSTNLMDGYCYAEAAAKVCGKQMRRIRKIIARAKEGGY